MKIFIIPTSIAEHLVKNISNKEREVEFIFPDLNRDRKRYFPDGEIYMRILKAGNLKNKRVIVLHSGAPRPNEGLIELELILQILKDHQVRPEVFFTYFPYGMQDKVFEKGETNVAENLVEKLINFYKVRKIYIIDAHFGKRKWTKRYPILNISAAPILIEMAKKDFGKKILFLSPDIGGKRRTKISGFRKERLDSFNVKIFPKELNLKDEIVGAVDDMIKTGGTLLRFYEMAKKFGVKKIIALITHGVMKKGIEKVEAKFDKIYLTNTINQKKANVDITDLILKVIKS